MSDLWLLILGYVLLVLGSAMIGYYYGYRQAEIDSLDLRKQPVDVWEQTWEDSRL